MSRVDVFRGVGDTSRLRTLLLTDTRQQPGCMGHQLTAAFEDLADDVAELTHRVESVEARTLAGADAAGQRETEQREPEQCDYLVYLGTPSGYRLSENRGVPPEVGSSIVELGATVLRIGRSPFPGDPRTCIFAIS